MHYDIGRLGDRFVAYWYEEDGKRVRIRLDASSKDEAKAEGLRVWENYQRSQPGGLLMEDLQRRYANYLGNRKTGIQLAQFWKFMGPIIGPYRPEDIDDDVVKDYLKHRQQVTIAKRGKPLSNGTLRAEVNMIQCIMNYGVRKQIIKGCVQLDKPMQPAPKDRWLDHPEIDLLLAEMAHTPHLYTATLLMLATAGRVTAVLDLTWDRVDFEQNHIDLRIDPTEPAKGRARVPMNDGLRAHLLELREHSDSWHVVAYRGKPINKLSKGFKAHCRAAGLPDVSPHALRHSAAVHMVAAGCEMAKVSQYLGHSSLSTTFRIYGRFAPKHLVKEAAAVDFITKH